MITPTLTHTENASTKQASSYLRLSFSFSNSDPKMRAWLRIGSECCAMATSLIAERVLRRDLSMAVSREVGVFFAAGLGQLMTTRTEDCARGSPHHCCRWRGGHSRNWACRAWRQR